MDWYWGGAWLFCLHHQSRKDEFCGLSWFLGDLGLWTLVRFCSAFQCFHLLESIAGHFPNFLDCHLYLLLIRDEWIFIKLINSIKQNIIVMGDMMKGFEEWFTIHKLSEWLLDIGLIHLIKLKNTHSYIFIIWLRITRWVPCKISGWAWSRSKRFRYTPFLLSFFLLWPHERTFDSLHIADKDSQWLGAISCIAA